MNKASIIKKIIIRGELVLESPLLIGSGLAGVETDIHVLKNRDGVPFIPGTSLAGALRSVLVQYKDKVAVARLFGSIEKDVEQQSAVAVQDVTLNGAKLTVRDGVSLDTYTKSTIKGHKYNYEAVERGARGAFLLEATLRAALGDAAEDAVAELTTLARQLAGGIHVGALTAKGFGRVRLADCRLSSYDFTDFAAVTSYLLGEAASQEEAIEPDAEATATSFSEGLSITADFALNGALIVRDYAAREADGKDPIAAKQKKSGADYLIPGTSIKGALRHHAEEILDVLGKSQDMLTELMGCATDTKKQRSRLMVEECYIRSGVREVRQSRNRIDRFTGGTVDSALFTEIPVWQEEAGTPTVRLQLSIRRAEPAEAGLMLYLLRELWQGRLPLGGEAGIGRGTLRGLGASIVYHGATYELDAAGLPTTDSARNELADLARQFYEL